LNRELESFKPMGGSDQFAWAHGPFSPANAYKWLIGRGNYNPSLMDKDCAMVWHFKIPLPITIVLWLSRRNGLITGELRHTRLGVPPQNCPLCNFPTDSSLHIFSTCLVTDQENHFSRSVALMGGLMGMLQNFNQATYIDSWSPVVCLVCSQQEAF
jgi:hypothetical protein